MTVNHPVTGSSPVGGVFLLTTMNKGKLKVLVRALKEIVEELDSEIYSDVDSYKYENYNNMTPLPTDYDEVFEDDDG